MLFFCFTTHLRLDYSRSSSACLRFFALKQFTLFTSVQLLFFQTRQWQTFIVFIVCLKKSPLSLEKQKCWRWQKKMCALLRIWFFRSHCASIFMVRENETKIYLKFVLKTIQNIDANKCYRHTNVQFHTDNNNFVLWYTLRRVKGNELNQSWLGKVELNALMIKHRPNG